MINPNEIEVIVEGYNYGLPSYRVTNEGIQDAEPVCLNFCRGDKSDDSKPRQQGVFVESVLEAVLHRLETVNTGDLANKDTSLAITYIENALLRLQRRSRDRKTRKVEGTYSK